MPTITHDDVKVPVDVLPEAREEYIENYLKATRGTGRLMLFACDQKIETSPTPSPSICSRSAARASAVCWPVSAA